MIIQAEKVGSFNILDGKNAKAKVTVDSLIHKFTIGIAGVVWCRKW
jgi:hypothetical protein